MKEEKENVKLVSTEFQEEIPTEDLKNILLILHQEGYKKFIELFFEDGITVLGTRTKSAAVSHIKIYKEDAPDIEIPIEDVDDVLLHIYIHMDGEQMQEQISLN